MKQFTDRIKKRIMSDGIFRCSIIAVLLLLFAYLIKAVGWKEFWYDEVATIGYVRSGLSLWDVLHYYQTIEVTNLPLYAVIEYFFYHFFPPEDIWLLLPGILMTLAGVARSLTVWHWNSEHMPYFFWHLFLCFPACISIKISLAQVDSLPLPWL